MKKPEYEVILLNEDVLTGTASCPNHCGPDCLNVQTECNPICVDNNPNVCDCVDGDNKKGIQPKSTKAAPKNPLGDFTNTFF